MPSDKYWTFGSELPFAKGNIATEFIDCSFLDKEFADKKFLDQEKRITAAITTTIAAGPNMLLTCRLPLAKRSTVEAVKIATASLVANPDLSIFRAMVSAPMLVTVLSSFRRFRSISRFSIV